MNHPSRRKSQAGMTLIELLIAVTLFGAISVGMGMVLNIAFTSMNKIDSKVDFNRRILASQRTLDQILQGLIPVVAPCGGFKVGFQGTNLGTRFVSSHSLTEGSRGRPQIVELFADQSPNGGLRLLLNERPYLGKYSLSVACGQPFRALPTSFILADRLAVCDFTYKRVDFDSGTQAWLVRWAFPEWPYGIQIAMAPNTMKPNQIQPTPVFAPLLVRNPNLDDILQ